MTSFRDNFTVKRKASGSYDSNGVWQEGSESTITISATVQPLKPEEVKLLPEGRRLTEAVKIYTDTELVTLGSNQNPDIVEAFGNEFEIVSQGHYQSGVISHYKCVGLKLS